MEHRYFTTSDGVKLHYGVFGEGKRPLVCLPGWGCPVDNMAQAAEALSGSRTVYALDYRWHGLSESPEGGWHTERLALDLREMLADAGIGEFDLWGHSMGNAVGWCYMELFGQEGIGRYVLEEEGPCLVSDPDWSEEDCLRFRGTMDWPSYPPALPGMPEMPAQMRDLFHDHVGRDWRAEIPTIKLPTLMLYGTSSHFGEPALWQWMQESIAGSKLVTMDGGHNLHVDCRDEFVAAVRDFLA